MDLLLLPDISLCIHPFSLSHHHPHSLSPSPLPSCCQGHCRPLLSLLPLHLICTCVLTCAIIIACHTHAHTYPHTLHTVAITHSHALLPSLLLWPYCSSPLSCLCLDPHMPTP